MSKNETYIAYNRRSTEGQDRSGLGLEVQQAQTKPFIASCGASAKLMVSYTEVESGKRAERPELTKALEHAWFTDGCLLIARLDSLRRERLSL